MLRHFKPGDLIKVLAIDESNGKHYSICIPDGTVGVYLKPHCTESGYDIGAHCVLFGDKIDIINSAWLRAYNE